MVLSDDCVSRAGMATGLLLLALSLVSVCCTRYLPPASLHTDSAVALAALTLSKPTPGQGVVEANIVVDHDLLGEQSLRALLVLRKPGDMRLQLLSPTDDLLAMATVNASEMTYFERGGEACYVGPPCEQGLSSVLPLPISPRDLVPLLLGSAPLPDSVRADMAWDERVGKLALEGKSEATERRVWVEPCTYAFWGVEWVSEEGKVVRGIPEPDGKGVRFRLEEKSLTIRVEYTQVDYAMAVGSDAFEVPCPAGMQVIELKCDDEGSP